MKYCGIDLHSNNSVIVVIDDEDRVVARKRLPNELARIVEFVASWRDELAGVVVESTYNWYWLVDGLQAAGFEAPLANTAAIGSTTASSTAAMKRTPGIWRICCGWGFCRRERSCLGMSGPCEISRESACSWCAAARRTSWRSRTSWPGSLAGG